MTSYSQPHPDVTGWFAHHAVNTYELERRRFALEYPDEPPPPELIPFPHAYVKDIVALFQRDSKQMAIALAKARNQNNAG